jgi:dynein light chain Tctex-type 1
MKGIFILFHHTYLWVFKEKITYMSRGYKTSSGVRLFRYDLFFFRFRFFSSICRIIFDCILKRLMDDTNETSFVVDEVSNVIKESIEATIGSQSYQQAKINTWTSNIVEAILNSLTKLNKPFKYIVSCVIMQKNGAGLHTASSCFWDNTTDGSCTVR